MSAVKTFSGSSPRLLSAAEVRMARSWAGVSDEELLDDFVRTGSPLAVTKIVERHGLMVLRICRNILGNLHDAEDAAQSVFLELVRWPGRVQCSLGGWLARVARNTAVEMLRSRVARNRREEFVACRQSREPASPDQAHVHEELLAAVKRLPTRLREPVRLCYLEGRCQQEAARLVGCHQSSLSRRLIEGLGRLRSTLLRRGVVASAVGLGLWFKTKVGVATAAAVLIGGLSTPIIVKSVQESRPAAELNLVQSVDQLPQPNLDITRQYWLSDSVMKTGYVVSQPAAPGGSTLASYVNGTRPSGEFVSVYVITQNGQIYYLRHVP
jgi:RNA polymerase sigma factor (sigma-70 family)